MSQQYPPGGGYGAPPDHRGYGQVPNQYQAAYTHTTGVLELNLTFFFLQWLLLFVTPRVVINGYQRPQKWGRQMTELPPGNHHVHVSFPYLFNDKCGPAETMVPIHAGMVTRLHYETPFLVFMSGTVIMSGPFQLSPPLLQG